LKFKKIEIEVEKKFRNGVCKNPETTKYRQSGIYIKGQWICENFSYHIHGRRNGAT
jgi:hypothetical protein